MYTFKTLNIKWQNKKKKNDLKKLYVPTRSGLFCQLIVVLSLSQGLFSSVICPGLVMTNLTYGILPSFLWSLIMPLMYLVGVCHHMWNFVLHFEWNYCMCYHILSISVLCRLDSSPTHSHSHPTMEQKRWYGNMVTLTKKIGLVCIYQHNQLFCTSHSAGCSFRSQSVWIQEPSTTVWHQDLEQATLSLDRWAREQFHLDQYIIKIHWSPPPLNPFIFQMDIDDEMSEVLYSKLLELEEEVRHKQREETGSPCSTVY